MGLRSILRLRPLRRALVKARWVGGRCFMGLCHGALGVKPNRIYFSSFKGRGYTDSPARICEALHALRPDLELVWQMKRREDAPGYVRVVRPRTPAALWAISTARCLVDNMNRQQYMVKFPDQLYVQTWHGDRGFKKMLFDMDDGQTFPDGKQIDLAVSGSDFGTKNYRTAFRYPGEVMQLGIPRNDALVAPDPKKIADVRRRLGLPEGVKVLLYVPTFRAELAGHGPPAGFDIGRALDRLRESTGSEWLCLTRAHSQNLRVSGAQDQRVRDVTDWPETNELLLCADMLISDYSSTAGDYVLLDRPVLLYQGDYDRFVGGEREMYFDLRSCPYVRAESEEELYRLLGDIDALIPSCAEVRRFYGVTETGHSTQAVAAWILEKLEQPAAKRG